ncbi:MAG: chorismate synthase [Candidatus Protochlamydia sp.]|nr:chorismate synthase [Candidatus Protochlamydia sp.]
MAANSFGTIFKMTTWGESHGKAIGVVIDGCPANLEISTDEINAALALRAPGVNPYTSPRREDDTAEILSGLFEGRTTGAPICISIANQDADPSKYEPIKDLLRPGHANYTYLEKYGIFDYRGGGRASARETAGRVAAGTIAKKFLEGNGIQLVAYIRQIGSVGAIVEAGNFERMRQSTYQSPVYCPDVQAASSMIALIEKAKAEGDSLGGVVEFMAFSVPAGLGDPVYEKLGAKLAHAMMSLPAAKGFEIGAGFRSACMAGSEHNDLFTKASGEVRTQTNHAGGILGGISTGMPIIGRVAFKPPSSIMKTQETLTLSGEQATFRLPSGSRHDPCLAIRAVPVVEAMVALVLADAILLNRCAKR